MPILFSYTVAAHLKLFSVQASLSGIINNNITADNIVVHFIPMLVLSKYKSYPTDQTEFIIAGMMLQYSKVTVKVKMFDAISLLCIVH